MAGDLKIYRLNKQPFPRTDPKVAMRFESSDLKNALGTVRHTLGELGVCAIYGNTGTGISYAAKCASKTRSAAH